jgi:beta-lactamase class A
VAAQHALSRVGQPKEVALEETLLRLDRRAPALLLGESGAVSVADLAADAPLAVRRPATIPPMSSELDAVAAEIAETFAQAGAHGSLHACPVQGGGGEGAPEVALDADTVASAASVIKIVVAVAFARAVDAGTLEPGERVEVPAPLRIGGSGTAGFLDPPVVSLRDLALSMMTVSDNAATDLIVARVGSAAIDRVISDLGLTGTRFVRDMGTGARLAAAELGFPDERDIDARLAAADADAIRALAWLDPAQSNAMTPRDATTLLAAIWTDRAGSAPACAFVRSTMAQQLYTQRLASGFPDGVAVAGKTGTIPTVRNESGVVTYSDGRAYAVSVFTRSDSLADRNPALDAAIGRAAAIAVSALRH